MKYYKLFLWVMLYMCLQSGLYSQQPYLPKFKQADPLWQHVLVNPLFQKHPDGRLPYNPYTCVSTQLTAELIVDSFLISVVPTLSELVFLDALIVQKINMNTGQVLWKDIIYDATIDSIGWVSLPYILHRRKDGNIEFCGSRKIKDDNIQMFDYSYRVVYDFETGQRTSFYDKTNTATYPEKIGSLNGRYDVLIEDSLYLKTYNYFEGGEQPKRGLSFCLVNAHHDSIQFIKTILMDPQMPVHRFTFRGIKADVINDSIYAVLLNLEAPQGSSFPGKNMLYLFNYKDIHNIHLVKTLDITDYAIYDWRPGGIPAGALKLQPHNGEILITDVYYDSTERKQFNYWLMLDDHGNVLDYIDKINTSDDSFYFQYIPIHITDTLKLFWAYTSQYSDTDPSFDIVKMNDKKEMEYIASFFPVGDQGEYFDPTKTLFVDNKLIFYGVYALGVTNDENGEPRYTHYILAFDLDELKKGSQSVNTSEPIEVGREVVVYPNPTRDKFQIKGVNDIINVHIFDHQGRVYPVPSDNYEEIDIESYPAGVYFIKIETKDSYKTLKVVKQ